jgi:hypothetical protein
MSRGSPSPAFPTSFSLSSPEALSKAVEDLKFFLATAPTTFPPCENRDTTGVDYAVNRMLLPTGENVSCVLWKGLYHISGTDVLRALSFRFLAFGRPVHNAKKFESAVFSKLRNLHPGIDATLEERKVRTAHFSHKNVSYFTV